MIKSELQLAQSKGLLPYFKEAASRYNIPVEILLAVASRETQIGTSSYYLQNNYTGRDGHGKGIMQIDDRYHTFANITNPSNNEGYINYGAKYLNELRNQFGNIRDALIAYNAGPDAVYNARALGINPDHLTTGGDYSFDVLQRADLIRSELGLGFANMATLLPAAVIFLAGSTYLFYQYANKELPTFLINKTK